MRPERLLTPAYQMINTSRGGGGWQGQPNESSTQVSSQPEPPCRSGSSRRRRVTQSHGGTNTPTHTTPPPPLCPRSPLSLQGFPNYLPSVLHTQNSTRCLLNSHSLHSQFSSFTSSVKKKFLISDRTHSPAPLQKA